jgi:N-acetylglucosaminyldiphosphoundecaprenol N-acetyl-beta-D-mannosaminyltransferase
MRDELTGGAELLGMRIDPLTPEETVQRVLGSRAGGCLLTPNLQHLREFRRSPAVAEAFDRCELVVADGMPLVWASRIQGSPLPCRVPGSDLVWSLSEEAAECRRSLFLLGGSPGTAEEAAKVLAGRYPALRVAGTHCPPMGFERSSEQIAQMRRAVELAQPDLVYLALPLEKQLITMATLRPAVPDAWLIGLGVSLSFVTGEVRRAPQWLQRAGLEWLFRLSQEPRRLARRYLREGIPMFCFLFAAVIAARAGAELSRLRSRLAGGC